MRSGLRLTRRHGEISSELIKTRDTLELYNSHLELLLIGSLQCAQEMRVLHLVVLLLAELAFQDH